MIDGGDDLFGVDGGAEIVVDDAIEAAAAAAALGQSGVVGVEK